MCQLTGQEVSVFFEVQNERFGQSTHQIKQFDGDSSKFIEFIPHLLGQTVHLYNGCTVFLKERIFGMIPVSSPYGVDSYMPDFATLGKWLSYWDGPRTETGELIDLNEKE